MAILFEFQRTGVTQQTSELHVIYKSKTCLTHKKKTCVRTGKKINRTISNLEVSQDPTQYK